jgi:anthranilate synthase component I
LRTMVIKNGVAYVQAGGGIVADSTPEGEYEESVNKAKALFTALEAAHAKGSR